MAKKTLIFCILMACCWATLWAGGRKENESRSAEDPAGFTDSIDISQKPPGKWNFYIEAKDKAGNVSLAGPDNIYNDPESDLPIVTIINPLVNMRVQGNLNIVGLAVDDDAVDYVEITVTRGWDGKGEELVRTKAVGTDYWSYFLDTSNPDIWTDGVYTITAWATDIYGLNGYGQRTKDEFPAGPYEKFKPKQYKFHQVYFNLDRKKPDTRVTSHEVGALIAGKIRLKGTVADGNGIDYFAYSLDEGVKYTPVKVSFDKNTGGYNWEFDINTKALEDGPQVVWFQAKDGQGTLGSAAHLLFVNNTGPEVKIVSPKPDEIVNGIFTVAAFAKHPVGVKSVSWKADKQGGEFPIIIGNHWYSADIDLRNIKTTSIEIEVRAEDVSGNVTVAKQKYKVDQNADLPTISMYEPSTGDVLKSNNLMVRGMINDDDGAASVFYQVDNGAPVELQSSGLFQFIVSELSEGTHSLDVWAKDITGVIGPKTQIKNIQVPGPLPEPGIASFTTGTGQRAQVFEFYTGMTLVSDPRMVMEFTVKAASVSTASITFGDLPPLKVNPSGGKDGYFRANVNVPANIGSGFKKIEMRATDRWGQEGVFEEYIFVDAPSGRNFEWVRPKMTPNGSILLSSADDALLGFGADPVSRAELRGSGAENFVVRADEYGRVVLQARREGSFGPMTLAIGARETSPFRIVADFTGPSITLREVPEGQWVQTSVPVRFNVGSATRLTSVEYSTSMGEGWLPLLTNAEVSGLSTPIYTDFSRTIDIRNVEDGAVNVLIRAVNEGGNTGMANFTVQKDTKAPEAQLIMPFEDASVNGTIRLGFSVKEAGKLKSVRYSRPGGREIEVFNSARWEKDYAPLFIEVTMDSIEMPLAENMVFTFEDEAGNTSTVRQWPFIIDNEADIPIVQIVLPLENEVITTDFAVSGVMFDDDEIKQIYWHIDNNPDRIVTSKNGFFVPIMLNSLTDNEHSVTVVAEDIYGVKSAPVTRNFRVSLKEPEAAVIFPTFEDILKETITITGTAFDRNGIEKVEVSVDNGNTYNYTTGSGNENYSWRYTFNTKILKDGAHVVFIRAWDKYGIPATYSSMINIDNTNPDITLDSPGDGSVSTGKVFVMGRVEDPNLEEVNIELRSLEGTAIPSNLRSRQLGNTSTIRETLDISGLRDGLYNVEIVATDKAGNLSRTSRNVDLARASLQNFVEIYYPLDNENVQGVFNLYGVAGGTDEPGMVTLRVNGRDMMSVEVDDSGYYCFNLDPESFDNNSGDYSIVVHSNFGGSSLVQSRSQTLKYKVDGAWVTIDGFTMGDFAYDRPYITGRAGFIWSDEDEALYADKDGDKDEKARIKDQVPEITQISFDNGKTYYRMSGRMRNNINSYSYRLETGEMVEGMHYILIRAIMKNGDVAVTRMLLQVDKTPPVIRLISPEAGGHYNNEIAYSASATDDVELVSLNYYLRKGDKNAYEVPGFLQGLYFEGVIPPFMKQVFPNLPVMPFGGGATYTDFALGLSFFEDNVKIQGQYGFMTQDLYDQMGGVGDVRYGGHVLGIKLLASIYQLPFGSFAGPDWEWLSATFAIGANFSLFDMGLEGYTQSGERTWMSALLFQTEFPRVTIPKRKNFRTFSMFEELQLWFVPTDVNAKKLGIKTKILHIIIGMRLYIF